MRAWLAGLMILLGSLPLCAQSTNPVSGYCDLGGSKAQVSGLGSTNYQQGDIPGCTIAVYLHGTQSLATIYSDSNNTPLSNPFTAVVASSPNAGFYIFWAATGQGYDVVASGGTAPNTYPAPQTIKEVFLGGGGGGGGSPCGTTNDVQTNAGGGNFGCDSGFLYNTASNHTLFQNIFSAMLKVLVSDTTHSGQAAFGASNGTSITNTYTTGVNATLAATYGDAVPDNVPTQIGQAKVISSLTPVEGLYPQVWGLPNGKVSIEYLYPLDSTNAPSPTTTNDIIRTLFTQGVSKFFRGPLPSTDPRSPIIQDRICSLASSGVVTCLFDSPITPGDSIYVVGGDVCGLACFPTFTASDTLNGSLTQIDTSNGTGLTVPSANFIFPGSIGGVDTVTFTPSVIQADYNTIVHIMEVRGTVAVDVHGTAGNSSIPITFAAVTTTAAPDLIVASAVGEVQSGYTPGTGFLIINQGAPLTQSAIVSEAIIENSTGTYTPTITAGTGQEWTSYTVAFKNVTFGTLATPYWNLIHYVDLCASGDYPCPTGITNGQLLTWNTASQIWQAVSPSSVGTIYLAGTDSGSSGTNYVLISGNLNANSNSCPATLTTGVTASIVPAHSNSSTTPTFQLCGLGSAATIVKNGPAGQVALATGDMITNQVAGLKYDTGTSTWELQNPSTGPSSASFSALTSGTNTAAAMLVGAGASLAYTSTGTVDANKLHGTAITGVTGTGNTVLDNTPTLITPVIGAATGTSLLVTGIIDGKAPITITTGAACTLGTASGCNSTKYLSGYTYNQEATAATAITYTLPTAAAGLQYCIGNSYNGSAMTTGTLELLTSASGQYIIYGALSATNGYVISAGSASDLGCVVGVDATHWQFYPQGGVWTLH